MTYVRFSVSCVLVFSMTGAASRSAFAENLLANATFDRDLSGWTSSSGAAWTPQDAQGREDSGSALLLVAGAAQFGNYPRADLSTCVPVNADDDHRLGATVLRTGRARHAWTYVRVSWSGFTDCRDILSSDGIDVAATASWSAVETLVRTPKGARSARIELEVGKLSGSAGPEVIGRFDDVVFEPVPRVPGTSTTTSTTLGDCTCGDPVGARGERSVTLQDALFVLQAAVGMRSCEACNCDVNDDGDIDVIDALLTLRAAIGAGTKLHCPA